MKGISIEELRFIRHKARVEQVNNHEMTQDTGVVGYPHFQNKGEFWPQLDSLPYLLDRIHTFHQWVDPTLQHDIV